MRVSLRVKPGSRKGDLVEQDGDGLMVFLRVCPTKGAANEVLVELLAKYFNVAKTRVKIVRGQKSREKLVEIL